MIKLVTTNEVPELNQAGAAAGREKKLGRSDLLAELKIASLHEDKDKKFLKKVSEIVVRLQNGEAKFGELRGLLRPYIRDLLKPLKLPLKGHWAKFYTAKSHHKLEFSHNRRVLENFCERYNDISRAVFRACEPQRDDENELSSSLNQLLHDLYYEEIFLRNRNSMLASPNDEDSDFVFSSGYSVNPEIIRPDCFDNEGFDFSNFKFFQKVELKPVSNVHKETLNAIFQPLGLNFNQQPWQYVESPSFGSFDEESLGGFALDGDFPYLNRVVINQSYEIYGQYYSEDELISHEMAHTMLKQLGYEETECLVTNMKRSATQGHDTSQVHEFLAFAASFQHAPLVSMFEALGDESSRMEIVTAYLEKWLDQFFTHYGSSFSEFYDELETQLENIGYDPQNIESEKKRFNLFLKSLSEHIGQWSISKLEKYLAKRFLTKAQSDLQLLYERGAFESGDLRDLKETALMN